MSRAHEVRAATAVALLALALVPTPIFAQSPGEKIRALENHVVRLQEALNPALVEILAPEEVREYIGAAVEWMKSAQEESGRFRYEYLPYEDRYTDDDNIVRQAGMLYELGEVARRDMGTAYELKDTIRGAIDYFEERSAQDTYGGREFRCITTDAGGNECKLGATTLALAGIVGFVEAYPEEKETHDELIEDYKMYLLAMKKEGEGFRNRHYVDSALQAGDGESSFANGEALLALVRYSRQEDDDEVTAVINETFSYIDSPRVPFDTALYLWAMAALKDLHERSPDDAYVDYARDYTNWRMEPFVYRRSTGHNMCAYAEGLASALSLLTPATAPDEYGQYRDELDFWLAKSSRLQIGADDSVRLIRSDGEFAFETIEDEARAFGGFLTGDDELTQRIDFTQHCLSAYLQMFVDIDGQTLSTSAR